MVIFQYNLYIFRIHLWTVLYPKPCYNEPCYKEAVVYLQYCVYRIYSDRQVWANGVDPDETLQNAASHQGLHFLQNI